MEAREGLLPGEVTKALLNNQPLRATKSNAGVLAMGDP
jgi:hypothetical protein